MSKAAAFYKWKNSATSLKSFVDDHPGIKIKKSIISIPAQYREEFYHLCDVAAKDFIDENFSKQISQAEKLSESYIRVEKEILEGLGIQKITMLGEIDLFLCDPGYAIRRTLKNPMFELLANEIDDYDFEEIAIGKIEASLKKLSSDSHTIWIALGLIKLLKPDSFYRVSLYDLQTAENAFHDGMTKEVPSAVSSNDIVFEHANTVFVVADVILHSKLIDKYVAIKVKPARASTRAEIVASEKEWAEINANNTYKPDLLIYADDNLANLNLVADSTRMLRPDILVFSMDDNSDTEQKAAEIMALDSMLAPALQTYVLSPSDMSIPALGNEETDTAGKILARNAFCLLTSHYNESTLKPLVEMLGKEEKQ